MPLLKKKPFEKADLPENLRDDEEVFHCEMTNEIFRDYEEFSERMFLCNSMVWTCCMTGKSSLTYMEALESEENAKKSLKEFPTELKVPILYLASKTKRSSFNDMAEDVFMFAKDRFFIGENVETSFTTNKWKDSHVLQVIAPSPDQIKKAPVKNGNNGERHFFPPASLYKYEIEHMDAYDEDISEIMIVDCNQIRRKKGTFTRERCRLFLKQYSVQDDKGLLQIDPSVLERFGVIKMKFDQIFSGSLPNFDVSKKTGSGSKKSKQQTISSFLSKSGNVSDVKEHKLSLLEQMKKREEEFKLRKQQKEEEKLALKQKKKEDNLKIAAHLKDWYKVREDLELENLKKLPLPAPVKSRVPDKYFGDALMVLEFVDTFSKLLSVKDFFPGGFTLELMERALVEKEVAGPLTDIIQMLLTAIFTQQEEEASQYKTQVEETSDIKTEDVPENMTLHEATRLATLASKWSNKHQGLPLSRLPLYSLTVSEILRLHLLSSGARINENGAKWRYQERGGYTSEDDPGLYLSLHQPHILKGLAVHNVVQLPLGDKLKIMSCLIDQLLTYADIRDVIEERIEKTRQARVDLKLLQIAERKRDQEYQATKLKMKKQMKEDNSIKESDIEKLDRDAERKKADNEKKITKLMKTSYEKQVFIGWDRAHRKYLKLDSVPGVFVNREEKVAGECLKEPIKQVPALVGADRLTTVNHFKKIYEDLNSSDKENDPKSELGQVNGMINGHVDEYDELFACSTDPVTCVVHSDIDEHRWYFFHHREQIVELEDSLNKRGIRESELRTIVQNEQEVLCNLVSQTPVTLLNAEIEVEEVEPKVVAKPKKGKSRYEDANLGYPVEMSPDEVLHSAMVDNILEMEEKMFAGSLGNLRVKDRDAWRSCLAAKKYDKMDKTINKNERENGKLLKVKKEENSRSSTPEISNEMEIYQDPGRFLGTSSEQESDDSEVDSNGMLNGQTDDLKTAINCLAIALAQVAQAVEPKYLKKPLGIADISKNDKKKDFNVLDKWEQSLLASTSFSQVFLHYGTLDSCIMWSRSALLARCRICRRQRDSENMLLCDSCNLGHHLYCLKPKLTAIPQGDWYCTKCTREREKQKKLESPEPPPPKKKRRMFTDEEEEEESCSVQNEQSEVDETSESGISEERESVKLEVCKVCGSGGELLCCDKCSNHYHLECVRPILRRAPRGSWLCTSCKDTNKKKESSSTETRNSKRDNSDGSSDSEEDPVVTKKTHRTDEGRYDLPLHNAALQELLKDVMKHPDAWPFLRPVQKNEVPDYYDVIEKPMDFGTLKYKLNMGEYSEDSKFMADAVLIFQNCNTYNHNDDEVYKCGVRLLSHFIKKSKELRLRLPEEMENDFGEDEDMSSKSSTDDESSSDQEDQQKSRKRHILESSSEEDEQQTETESKKRRTK